MPPYSRRTGLVELLLRTSMFDQQDEKCNIITRLGRACTSTSFSTIRPRRAGPYTAVSTHRIPAARAVHVADAAIARFSLFFYSIPFSGLTAVRFAMVFHHLKVSRGLLKSFFRRSDIHRQRLSVGRRSRFSSPGRLPLLFALIKGCLNITPEHAHTRPINKKKAPNFFRL